VKRRYFLTLTSGVVMAPACGLAAPPSLGRLADAGRLAGAACGAAISSPLSFEILDGCWTPIKELTLLEGPEIVVPIDFTPLGLDRREPVTFAIDFGADEAWSVVDSELVDVGDGIVEPRLRIRPNAT
jgi:hypothetical protein